ncbi:MAG: glutamine-hydrolyzing GMP synthase [Candidatus Odinarchaeum yellowstonii]|uniref:Glutamine-hydrolyzing GMP synthase n=1 Tax=Odinarchaeota yellowstonii (strain LCB_4) TaxID=1841599 RepID=A0AAF0IBW9_ODILC|nr:MAG: glutamine-hydrolyzing GMP synthase [Candidatus Odinarchaeum yellowstonii]
MEGASQTLLEKSDRLKISMIMDRHILERDKLDIAILDFGGQYTHLIKRMLDELDVEVDILPYNVNYLQLLDLHVKGVIFGGGPNSVYEADSPRCDLNILRCNRFKILGICYGHQLIAHQLDGVVKKGVRCEYGLAELLIDDVNDPLFQGFPSRIQVWASHTDEVEKLPLGGKTIAHSLNCSIEAFNIHNRIWGVQFHPEVSQTEYGYELLENFAIKISKCNRIQI